MTKDMKRFHIGVAPPRSIAYVGFRTDTPEQVLAADYADYADGAQKVACNLPHLRNPRNLRLNNFDGIVVQSPDFPTKLSIHDEMASFSNPSGVPAIVG
jgi:hypothetical protein